MSSNPGRYTHSPLDDRPGQYPNYADVKFSTASISIKGGQSATFTATFSPNHVTDVRYLPIYSGFIKVRNNNDEFTITYLGQPYSRKDAHYLQEAWFYSDNNQKAPTTDIGYFDLPSDAGPFPYFTFTTLQTTPKSITYFVEYNTTFVPDYYGFIYNDSSIPYGVPESALPLVYPNTTLGKVENGLVTSYGHLGWYNLDSAPSYRIYFGFSGTIWNFDENGNEYGTVVAPGDYRALIMIAKWNGNLESKDGWETWLSPIIRLM